jgi:hypothetical protein
VRDAGGAKQVPVAAFDSGLVADRQRGQHARRTGIGNMQRDCVTHALAQSLDRLRAVIGQVLGWRAWAVARTSPVARMPC